MGFPTFYSPLNINNRSRICKEIILSLGLFFLPGLLFPARPTGQEFNDPRYLVSAAVLGLGQLAFILFLIFRGKNDASAFFGLKRLSFRGLSWGFLAFLALFPLAFLVLGFIDFLSPPDAVPPFPGIPWAFNNYPLLPLVAAVCLLTGYREELYFRSFLPLQLGALGIPLGAAALGANLLFSLGHLYQGKKAFLLVFLLGGYLAVIFRWKRNLHINALAHGLYNLAVLLIGSRV